MVSFRKMSMAFAGCLLAGGIASAAPTPITCTATAASPSIRLEGLTEQIGKITLSCTTPANPVNTPTLLITFQLSSGGPQFTNNFLDKDARTLSGPTIVSAATAAGPFVALKDSAGVNDSVAKLSSDGKSVLFNTTIVPEFVAAAGAPAQTSVIVIDGLRINAQQSAGNLSKPTVTVTAVSYNNSNGDKAISQITDATQNVAQVQQAVNFIGSAASANLNCAAYSPDSTAWVAADRKKLAKVAFEPGYPSSLDSMVLAARFNVPAGAKLFVATSNTDKDGNWQTLAGNFPYALHAAATEAKFVEVKANDDGIYEYTWAVQDVGDGTSTFYFPVFITIPQNFVAANGLTALGGLSPFSTDATAVEDGDIPRFVTPTTYSDAIISVGSCTTTLLFPYVTNVGNWDTGIAITNPTADMKDDAGKWASGNKTDAKVGQNGTCTLYFVGDNAPAKAIKSSTINAGQTVAFLVSGGSEDFGIAGVPGFNGYLKVSCTFSEGRGFAFMSSSDLGGVGVGYVAEGGVTLVP